MTTKTSKDFDPQTLKLFDQYVHGDISRREFLTRAAKYTVAGVTALSVLQALTPNFVQAQQIAVNDSRLKAEYVEIPSPGGNGKIRGYLVQPAAAKGKLPTVLVVHENRGLNPHIEDITRRVALDNFIAFAPDALFTQGGYPGDEDKARELFRNLDPQKTENDFVEAAAFLKTLTHGNGKVGVVGFCYGGGIANALATRMPDLAAAVPFYGRQGDLAKVAAIKAPLLIHYAGNDERVNAGAQAYDEALKAAGVKAQSFVYPNVEHGFNNDTTPRYDKPAADLAWQRTMAFFNQHLRP
jgi:carboxymethylenebutenolidase